MKIEITAIKYETVNGKKTGKSFRFRLDPRKMAASCKTEKSLRKKRQSMKFLATIQAAALHQTK